MELEFCEPNYCDANINSNVSITLTPTVNWYQEDVIFLYDHYQGSFRNNIAYKKLYSTGAADDTTTVTVVVDFGDDLEADTFRLIGFNFEDFTMQYKPQGGAYANLVADHTGYAYSSYHLYDTTIPIFRYLKITCNKTQTTDNEKFIGELYVGKRSIKLETGKALRYSISSNNPREGSVRDYRGFRRMNRVNPVFTAKLKIGRPSQAEADFFSDVERYGGMYDFFPAPDNTTALDPHMDLDQVYLVEATGKFDREPYGSNAKGNISVDIMETKYIA